MFRKPDDSDKLKALISSWDNYVKQPAAPSSNGSSGESSMAGGAAPQVADLPEVDADPNRSVDAARETTVEYRWARASRETELEGTHSPLDGEQYNHDCRSARPAVAWNLGVASVRDRQAIEVKFRPSQSATGSSYGVRANPQRPATARKAWAAVWTVVFALLAVAGTLLACAIAR
jgi:hypothetical protein